MKKVTSVLLGFAAIVALTAPASSYAQVQDPTMVNLVNPIGGTKENPQGTVEIPKILGGILTKALGVMGSAALLMFVIGGAMWLTSAGNSERVQKGTETMLWSAIGVLIIFSSYAILRLVLGGIGAEGLDGEGSATKTEADAANCIPDAEAAQKLCTAAAAKCKDNAFCAELTEGGKKICAAAVKDKFEAYCAAQEDSKCSGACKVKE